MRLNKRKKEIDELESRKERLEDEVQWLEDTIGRLRYITEIYTKLWTYDGLVSKRIGKQKENRRER